MNLKLTALFTAIIISVAGLGTAALTSVSIDRTISGQVTTDTSGNALIKFEAASGYGDAILEDGAGKVVFNLDKLFTDGTQQFSLNPNATFEVGGVTENDELFAITNNSDTAINVSIVNAQGGLTLLSSSTTIASGETEYFGFKVETGVKQTVISGTLRITD